MTPAPLNVTHREQRTILAALRCWLNELGFFSMAELHQHYPELGNDPLELGEVEALITRLRGGAK